MGKRFKRYRNSCCRREPSSDSENGVIGGKRKKPSIPRKAKKKSKNATDMKILRQEVDELGEKLKSLKESLGAVEVKFKATEREIGEFFSESLVEKMAGELAYRAPPVITFSRMEPINDNGISIFPKLYTSCSDENENLIGKDPLHTSTNVVQENAGRAFELSGRFGQTNGIGCGLARGKRQLKEKHFLDISGLAKTVTPLQSMQVAIHHELLTTLNFPFRLTLRDIMLRNKFDESHALFLCANLLITLRHLHSLNIIHGYLSPSKVMFTQFGYPCLTGVETSHIDVDAHRPKTRIEYTSPEQVRGEPVTEATDMFQTGILVYSMIYGKSPFKSDTYYHTRSNLLNEDFTPGFDSYSFTKDGRYFIRKLLQINPNDRFKLDSCYKPLEKTVKWFSTLNQDKLFSQSYPSPFKGPLMREIFTD